MSQNPSYNRLSGALQSILQLVTEVEFYSHLEQSDLIYVNNMLYQHDQLLLKDRREQRYLYLALQPLRTVK